MAVVVEFKIAYAAARESLKFLKNVGTNLELNFVLCESGSVRTYVFLY